LLLKCYALELNPETEETSFVVTPGR